MKISVLSTSPPATASKNWMKWKKMEIIAQQREEKTIHCGVVASWIIINKLGQHDAAISAQNSKIMLPQHSVRYPSVYLFISEDDETGQFIFSLCFPMAPPAAEGPRLETGENGDGGGQAGHREGIGLRASWAHRYSWTGQLGQQAGTAATARYASVLPLR